MHTTNTNLSKTSSTLPSLSGTPSCWRGIIPLCLRRGDKMKSWRGSFLWFTLVELIVVITILVILGTIAFLNLWGFSGSARDSARISNLANLQKGLNVYQVRTWTYPMPESSVAITASWTPIGYQWFAKDIVWGIAKISKWWTVDPSDTSIYTTYAVNQTLTKMQAMVFLEDSANVTAFNLPLPLGEGWGEGFVAYAATTSDYSKRFPKTTGDTLWILLSTATGTLNQPVQETGTGVDVVLTNTGYLAYVNNKSILNGTWIALVSLIFTMQNSLSLDYKCNASDITISSGSISQIWQACNIGSQKSGYSWESSWYKFQWGRKLPAIWPTLQWPVTSDPGTYESILSSNPDWLTVSDNDIYGGSGTLYSSIDATTLMAVWNFSTQTTVQQQKMQWPCSSGYHIPTIGEWITAFNMMSSTWYASISSGSIDDKINAKKVDNLIDIMKIPMAYNTLSNVFMSSSPANNDVDYNPVFWSNYVPSWGYVWWQYSRGFMINGTYKRGAKFVRCLKN